MKTLRERFPLGSNVQAFTLEKMDMEPAMVVRYVYDEFLIPHSLGVRFEDGREYEYRILYINATAPDQALVRRSS